ncbi:MAG TPA: nickel pincer cofactor biosynthesis protein LarB [bacterium]|nr:nickel pincer cofactor biosynthesis protein LarB [bacterium]
MDEVFRTLIDRIAAGDCPPGEALLQIRRLVVDDLGRAQLDAHRHLRQGFPEVVFAEPKSVEDLRLIAAATLGAGRPLVISRLHSPKAAALLTDFGDQVTYLPDARVLASGDAWAEPLGVEVLVLAAGTADLPVAEEAAAFARLAGCEVTTLWDCGVAGIHRLTGRSEFLERADLVIVVAGMEGALPSVVGGLTRAPVIAVPTSVGYGTGLDGYAAMLTMLNSCAAGAAVMNIDNGFGAGMFAGALARTIARRRAGDRP